MLEGTAIVTVDDGEPQTFAPGDAFVIQRGTPCTFDVQSPFLKYWMAYDPNATASSA